MAQAEISTLNRYFENITDTRRENKRHKLIDIITIASRIRKGKVGSGLSQSRPRLQVGLCSFGRFVEKCIPGVSALSGSPDTTYQFCKNAGLPILQISLFQITSVFRLIGCYPNQLPELTYRRCLRLFTNDHKKPPICAVLPKGHDLRRGTTAWIARTTNDEYRKACSLYCISCATLHPRQYLFTAALEDRVNRTSTEISVLLATSTIGRTRDDAILEIEPSSNIAFAGHIAVFIG